MSKEAVFEIGGPADRRTVLRSILAVGAIGAVPIAAGATIAAEPASGSSGLDAELLALIETARHMEAQIEAAQLSADEAMVRGSGELDADALYQKLVDEGKQLRNRIARTPARTLAGVMAKLAFVAPFYDEDEMNSWEGTMEEGTIDTVLDSVAVDFKRLAKENARV